MWRTVYMNYQMMAPDRGWPELSEKALSAGLAELGCKTRQLDLRTQGRGRPRVLMWSAGEDAGERLAA